MKNLATLTVFNIDLMMVVDSGLTFLAILYVNLSIYDIH